MNAGRYAPSPTGDLHLGNLRTAVLAWLFARSTGRAFRLRSEDLDVGRVRPEYVGRQQADLTALGLAFDGPVLAQSTRGEAYAAAMATLPNYPCFCSRRDIADAASAPHGLPGHYPGTCRDLTATERGMRRDELAAAGRVPARRLRAGGATMTIRDALHGEVTGPVDDLVLWRPDGAASYHLASVVDDGATGVDQVVRGDDLLDAAVSQAWLAARLGHDAPTYAHVPLAVNAQGRRLAKRDGPVTLRELDPADVLDRIAVSLRLASTGERITPDRLLQRFDPTALPSEPWVVA